jgi:hypothetical protein
MESLTKLSLRKAQQQEGQTSHDVSAHQKKAIKAVEIEWKKRLDDVRPKGPYYK